MNSSPLISVIIPVYQVKAYLPQCLESIIHQTYRKLEIIVVDDGSTDGGEEICDRYASQDRRIKVIHKKNMGLVAARKTGLQAASGELITYVDGDDWIEPEMYSHMCQKMAEHSVDVVMCGHYENTGTAERPVYHGIPEGVYDRSKMLSQVFPKMVSQEGFLQWGILPNVWNKLFRREALFEFQLNVDTRITIGEDAACVYPCLLHANGIYVMGECLYHYRQTGTSMLKRKENAQLEQDRFRILYQTVYTQLEASGKIFDFRDQWKKFMLFLMVPRSDGVYQGFSDLDYLFPFSGVKKGSSIVLYGAGTYGQRLYSYLENTGFCKVVLWVDRNYAQFQKMGLPVDNPQHLAELNGYDAIVVANMFEQSRNNLYQELIQKYPQKKVCLIDVALIFSEETMIAFGLSK